MPQWKALTAGSLFALAAISLLIGSIYNLVAGDPSQVGSDLVFACALALPAALLLGLWQYRRQRDQRIISNARRQQLAPPPTRSQPGNDAVNQALFVPEPRH